ncbi:MAG TPA: sodium:proton antiporter, partial [Syntrophales bacterium]|nr:sodium:proton antiporter [Syntrophales bacterium]
LALSLSCAIAVVFLKMAEGHRVVPVETYMLAPFTLLLLAIAIVPFISGNWWGKNYPLVSFALAAVVVFYYFFVLENGPRMCVTAVDYFSFMAITGSLFVVSGGILIRIPGGATPFGNTVMLLIGSTITAVFSNTGASMILIRPYLRMNKGRLSAYHVVFFIFTVSNIGGLLTPVGPPLFLGYLKGVPFFWVTAHLWYIWSLETALVLLVFYLMDRHFYKKGGHEKQLAEQPAKKRIKIEGWHHSIFIVVILLAVFLETPVREIVMIASGFLSYLVMREEIHRENEFNFVPVKEVGILFFGIFATMVPVLDWLELNAGKIGLTEPGQFYWASGILSSFLDNAPTYLNFLSAACGLHGLSVDNVVHVKAMLGLLPVDEVAKLQIAGDAPRLLNSLSWKYVAATAAGSATFGACTYIGNGPNFMVKSIAEQVHVKMPSFFGYMIKYSIPILIPIFTLVWYLYYS